MSGARWVAAVLVALPGLTASAQNAAVPTPSPAAWPYPPLTAAAPPGSPVATGLPERVVEAVPCPRPDAPGQQHWVALNLSLLQPTVARVQVKVWPRENNSVWLEAYAGSVLFDFMYGFGARLHRTAWTLGNGDVVMVSPGLGVHILPNWYASHDYRFRNYGFYTTHGGRNTLTYLAGDVDVSWLHDFGPHFGFELGLKAGLAGRLAGVVGDDYPSGLMWGRNAYPILSVYSGLRF